MSESCLEYYRRTDPNPIVCPDLEKKFDHKIFIRQPGFGLWNNGELKNSGIQVGETLLWRRDVNDVKLYTEPIPYGLTTKEWTIASKNRAHIIIRVISEYGSTLDEGGWTRQMVMYEEGTPSPYPFTRDMFTQENDRMRQEIDRLYKTSVETTEKIPGEI